MATKILKTTLWTTLPHLVTEKGTNYMAYGNYSISTLFSPSRASSIPPSCYNLATLPLSSYRMCGAVGLESLVEQVQNLCSS
jgi:hypothetical protein